MSFGNISQDEVGAYLNQVYECEKAIDSPTGGKIRSDLIYRIKGLFQIDMVIVIPTRSVQTAGLNKYHPSIFDTFSNTHFTLLYSMYIYFNVWSWTLQGYFILTNS